MPSPGKDHLSHSQLYSVTIVLCVGLRPARLSLSTLASINAVLGQLYLGSLGGKTTGVAFGVTGRHSLTAKSLTLALTVSAPSSAMFPSLGCGSVL